MDELSEPAWKAKHDRKDKRSEFRVTHLDQSLLTLPHLVRHIDLLALLLVCLVISLLACLLSRGLQRPNNGSGGGGAVVFLEFVEQGLDIIHIQRGGVLLEVALITFLAMAEHSQSAVDVLTKRLDALLDGLEPMVNHLLSQGAGLTQVVNPNRVEAMRPHLCAALIALATLKSLLEMARLGQAFPFGMAAAEKGTLVVAHGLEQRGGLLRTLCYAQCEGM